MAYWKSSHERVIFLYYIKKHHDTLIVCIYNHTSILVEVFGHLITIFLSFRMVPIFPRFEQHIDFPFVGTIQSFQDSIYDRKTSAKQLGSQTIKQRYSKMDATTPQRSLIENYVSLRYGHGWVNISHNLMFKSNYTIHTLTSAVL